MTLTSMPKVDRFAFVLIGICNVYFGQVRTPRSCAEDAELTFSATTQPPCSLLKMGRPLQVRLSKMLRLAR